jgi:glycosyltransferase involved in cell wall biosynthesis
VLPWHRTVRTVVHFIDSRVFGGAEKAVAMQLAGLDRRRWRPMLVYHPEPDLAPFLEDARMAGAEVKPLPRRSGVRSLPTVLELYQTLNRVQPSIFHVHLNWPLGCKRGLAAAALARVPVIVATAQLFGGPKQGSVSFSQRLSLLTVDRFLAVSDWVASGLRDVAGVRADRIRVVPNGIHFKSFDRMPDGDLRAALSRGSPRPLVLTVARLHEQKGHRYLLEAAATMPDAIFVLAGDGPLRSDLETMARRLGVDDRVIFLGHREDIPELLAACDLFVLPSLFEGHPISVIEAGAARKPIIATAIGGTSEAILNGETGLLVPPADPGALAAAIRTLLASPDLAARMAHAASIRARAEYSAEAICRRTVDVYEELLASRERHDRQTA